MIIYILYISYLFYTIHCSTDFDDDFVKEINTFRKIHSSPPVLLDKGLSKSAESQARKISSNGNISAAQPMSGQNTYLLSANYDSGPLTALSVVSSWYNEVCNDDFNFNKPNNEKARSFTQLVWKDTSKVGIAKSIHKFDNNTRITAVVALFKPPGNIVLEGLSGTDRNNDFIENVRKGAFNQSYCKRFKASNKKRNLLFRRKNHLKREISEYDPTDTHQPYRRSLYYRFPAKFFIDPETGQTKAVATDHTTNPFLKSQVNAPLQGGFERPVYSYQYEQPHFLNNIPYTTSSLYNVIQPQTPSILSYTPIPPSSNVMSHEATLPSDIFEAESNAAFKSATPSVQMPTKKQTLGEKDFETSPTDKNSGYTATEAMKRNVADDISLMLAKALKSHNALREIHNVGKLELVQSLNDEAAETAKNNAKQRKLEHSSEYNSSKIGENLAFNCKRGEIASIEESIKEWYEAACLQNYDFSKEEQASKTEEDKTRHFRQIVWKDTVSMGCGRSITKQEYNGVTLDCVYYCCKYRPPANVDDAKNLDNVQQGSFDQSTCTATMSNAIQKAVEEVETKGEVDEGKASFKFANEPKNTAKEGEEGKPPEHNNTFVSPEEAKPPENNEENPLGGEEAQQDQDERNYEDDSVKVINEFRKVHGVPPLLASDDLHEKAKKRAYSFVSGSVKKSHKRSENGENVQVACNPYKKVIPPEEAITNWYREVCTKNFQFDKESLQNAPHFTQLIWKKSKSAGIAYATKQKKNGQLCTVIVAEFEPSGNNPGEVKDNIEKGKFDKSFCGSLSSIAGMALDEEGYQPSGVDNEDTSKNKEKDNNMPSEDKNPTGIAPNPESGLPKPDKTGNKKPNSEEEGKNKPSETPDVKPNNPGNSTDNEPSESKPGSNQPPHPSSGNENPNGNGSKVNKPGKIPPVTDKPGESPFTEGKPENDSTNIESKPDTSPDNEDTNDDDKKKPNDNNPEKPEKPGTPEKPGKTGRPDKPETEDKNPVEGKPENSDLNPDEGDKGKGGKDTEGKTPEQTDPFNGDKNEGNKPDTNNGNKDNDKEKPEEGKTPESQPDNTNENPKQKPIEQTNAEPPSEAKNPDDSGTPGPENIDAESAEKNPLDSKDPNTVETDGPGKGKGKAKGRKKRPPKLSKPKEKPSEKYGKKPKKQKEKEDETPEEGKAPEDSQAPEHNKTPDSGKTPEKGKTPGQNKTPENSKTPEEGKTPEQSKTPEHSKTPEQSKTPDHSKTPEQSKTPEEGKTPEQSETPEQSKTPEQTETTEQDKTPEQDKKPDVSKPSEEGKTPQEGLGNGPGNTPDNEEPGNKPTNKPYGAKPIEEAKSEGPSNSSATSEKKPDENTNEEPISEAKNEPNSQPTNTTPGSPDVNGQPDVEEGKKPINSTDNDLPGQTPPTDKGGESPENSNSNNGNKRPEEGGNNPFDLGNSNDKKPSNPEESDNPFSEAKLDNGQKPENANPPSEKVNPDVDVSKETDAGNDKNPPSQNPNTPTEAKAEKEYGQKSENDLANNNNKSSPEKDVAKDSEAENEKNPPPNTPSTPETDENAYPAVEAKKEGDFGQKAEGENTQSKAGKAEGEINKSEGDVAKETDAANDKNPPPTPPQPQSEVNVDTPPNTEAKNNNTAPAEGAENGAEEVIKYRPNKGNKLGLANANENNPFATELMVAHKGRGNRGRNKNRPNKYQGKNKDEQGGVSVEAKNDGESEGGRFVSENSGLDDKVGENRTSVSASESLESESNLPDVPTLKEKPDKKLKNHKESGVEEGMGPQATSSNQDQEKPAKMSEFMKEAWVATNALRSIHGSKRINPSQELIDEATEYAKVIAQQNKEASTSQTRSLEKKLKVATKRQSINDYGMNTFTKCYPFGKELSPDQIILSWWAGEFCDKGPNAIQNKVISPGSQLVWNKTSSFGMALENYTLPTGATPYCYVAVALYLPKGNNREEFEENVKQGEFEYVEMCDDVNNTMEVAKEVEASAVKDLDEGDKPLTSYEESGTEKLDQEEFINKSLEVHNLLREIHEAPKLKRDRDLSIGALKWAKNIAEVGKLSRSNSQEYGESLAFKCSSGEDVGYTGDEPTIQWYSEACEDGTRREFDFKSNKYVSNARDFTQMVWKNSKKFGIAYARAERGNEVCYYAVARYSPPGNKDKEFLENVKEGKFNKDTCDHLDAIANGNTSKRGDIILSRNNHDENLSSFKYHAPQLKGILRKKGYIQQKKKKSRIAKKKYRKRNKI